MKDYSKYIEMQKGIYNNKNIPSEDIVGYYDWNEAFPYETFLLYENGDVRKPLFKETNDKVALDFACGPGRMVRRMSKCFKKVDGVDISNRLIEEAREKSPSNDFYVSNGDDLGSVPKNNYDFVYSTIAMQHIAVRTIRMNILKNIHEVLKEDGIINIQMAFSKDFPYNCTPFHNEENGIRVSVKTLDNTHATWMEDRINAASTNSGCDVGIGPADVPLVIKDFETYFRDVKVWFYDYSLFGVEPEDVFDRALNWNGYWATHFIFISGRK